MNLLALLVFVVAAAVIVAAGCVLTWICVKFAGSPSAWRVGLPIAVVGWIASGRL